MRLTQEQAAAVDELAAWVGQGKSPSPIGAFINAHLRVLDLLDQLRAASGRAEQAEKDLALLARHLTRKYEPDAFDALQRGLEHSIRLAGEAHDSAALQRAKGGAA